MKILISGTGIAGAAVALYLKRDDHDLTVIDRVPSFQKRGYGLALKSFGLDVMQDLGLFDALQKHALVIDTINILESSGTLIKACPAESMAAAAKGATMVYRSDLHQVLYDALAPVSTVRFDMQIAAVNEDADGVQVRFSNGQTDHFDLVVVAEGLRSTTRRLLWDDEGYTPFNVIYAAASVEHTTAEMRVLQWYLGSGTSFVLIPVDDRRALVQAYCRGRFERTDSSTMAKTILSKQFQGFHPTVLSLIDQLTAAGEMFFDNVAMVALPHLSKRRVVLLGDSGYCPTFLSGMGASLGLFGAKVLAQTLRNAERDTVGALERFNTLMQPLIRHFQQNAADHVQTLLTTSASRLWLRDHVMHAMPQAWLGWALGRGYSAEAALVHQILTI